MRLWPWLSKAGTMIKRAATWIGDRVVYTERMTGFRWTRRVLIALVAFLPLYYIIGMTVSNKVDDDIDFKVLGAVPDKASRAIAMAVSLVDREVNDNGWKPNDTLLAPCAFCDNMANFQRGVSAGLGQFAEALAAAAWPQKSEADADIKSILLLKTPANRWGWDSAEAQYAEAAKALTRYNKRIADGDVSLARDAAALARLLREVEKGLDADTDDIFRMATNAPGWYLFDWTSDDLFYRVKGRLYVQFMILRELQTDFADVLNTADKKAAYEAMLTGLRTALETRPFIVMNGPADSGGVPNHLTSLGFHALRAKGLLGKIADSLDS